MTAGAQSATIARITLATGAALPSLVVAGYFHDFGGIAAHDGHVYLMENPPYDDLTSDPNGPSFYTQFDNPGEPGDEGGVFEVVFERP
jgi:hypothetical protein